MRVFKADVQRTWNMVGSPRWAVKLVVCLRSPGVHAVAVFRFGQWTLCTKGILRALVRPCAMLGQDLIKILWGIELNPETVIGEGFYIGHFGGIVISPRAVIGKNFTCSQGVTIGVSGEGDRIGAPVIGANVYVAPGAKVFGRITVGNSVKIGANAVVYKDVPDFAVIVLDPGFRIISYKGNTAE